MHPVGSASSPPPRRRRHAVAAAFHIAPLTVDLSNKSNLSHGVLSPADPDAARTGAASAPDDARFAVSLDGTTLAPQWAGWHLVAVCRPWRAPGAPAHGPAVAIEAAGGPLWAEVVELTVWRDGCPLRLTQATRQGQLRRSLHGIEAEGDPAVAAGFLRTAQRLLAAVAAAVGGRPADLSVAEKRAVLVALVRRAQRDGVAPRRLSLDAMAELLDDACGQGRIRTTVGVVALPPPVSDHALDPDDNRRRRRERLRHWLRAIGLPRWREARTMLAAQTVSS